MKKKKTINKPRKITDMEKSIKYGALSFFAFLHVRNHEFLRSWQLKMFPDKVQRIGGTRLHMQVDSSFVVTLKKVRPCLFFFFK